ncbi:MAG: hypothetical protein JW797_12715 [Bradymonadales bacterium]|nr:hypothetical protein [Bradymonadales bacterium]
MNKMRIETNTDDNGALRIQIPGPPSRYQVHVIVEWEEAQESSDWPPGWIEATAGSITDPTFVRHPQGEYETREDLG